MSNKEEFTLREWAESLPEAFDLSAEYNAEIMQRLITKATAASCWLPRSALLQSKWPAAQSSTDLPGAGNGAQPQQTEAIPMAQHDRGMLNKHDIERFKTWLIDNRITWREGKGEFQLLQVKMDKGWSAICTDAKSVITSPPALRAMIQHFQAGKPFKVKAAAKPVEDQQFLNDLRDDFAMAALKSFLDLCPTEVWNQGLTGSPGNINHAEIVAKSAYCVADAMLAERAKRLGGAA